MLRLLPVMSGNSTKVFGAPGGGNTVPSMSDGITGSSLFAGVPTTPGVIKVANGRPHSIFVRSKANGCVPR